ncbi:dihydrodipicolinate synthase family protein [Ferrovibrio terrae]|uniref:Dihydrodipicolinate synthase family protein n=1 Tax=Ferrovibrio terrae TaxID=2594003 RepID=A0A516H1G0_9PROT|nr:dihydrodipicolinate synthase family protein [Ferrovibrio terrae]QDO97608.1 dihydrodipicolinate synthase family protein [Ferrovibrio terrae]
MAKLDESAKGVYIISVTPFTDSGVLDLDSTDRMVDFYVEKGVTGFTLLGMMGEAPKLTMAESRSFVQRVLKRLNGKAPVVVGASSPGFASMAELTKAVMDDGAAGVMIAPPGTLKTDDQIVTYYENAAEAIGTSVPFVLQDFPQSTNVHMTAGVIARIIKALPSCVMLKHEDWPGLAKLSALRAMTDLRRVSILVGNGGVFLPEEMERGADGAMTGFAYPEMMTEVVKAYQASKPDRARDIFDAYLPLARYEQQPGPGLAIRKYVLQKRGVIASAALRKPGPKLSALDIAETEKMIARQTRRLQEIG